jgi:hypothetical protein
VVIYVMQKDRQAKSVEVKILLGVNHFIPWD